MPSVKSSHAKTLDIHVGNVNRAFGTQLGAEITRLHPDGLPEDTITVHAQEVADKALVHLYLRVLQ